MRNPLRILIIVSLLAWFNQSARTQDFATGDADRIRELTETGTKRTGERITVWFARDALTSARMTELTSQLEAGLIALEQEIGSPRSWQRERTPTIEYYFAPGRFVQHASPPNRVFFSLDAVPLGWLPLLHETAHVLLTIQVPHALDDDQMPAWLHEGLATYLAKVVQAKTGIPDNSPNDAGELHQLDGRCAERLSQKYGATVVRFMGEPGAPPELFSPERGLIGPIFYPCSGSFSKFLAGQIGMSGLADLIPEHDPRSRLERASKETVDQLRRRWLIAIGAPGSLMAQ